MPADDLDLHVITPNGNEIYFPDESDYFDYGGLDGDKIPEVELPGGVSTWVENVFFEPGKALLGSYEFFVVNYNQINTADAWKLSVFLDDELQELHSGTTIHKDRSPNFKFTL
jgi:uncharacterized protein YfaP (DUF2135 family)